MASVSVIIPTWNRESLLRQLLHLLASQTLPPTETLVVDNGSVDRSVAIAEQMGARVILMDANTGFAKAVNRGIGESRSEWVAVMNNDVQPEQDWLERLTIGADNDWFAVGKLLDAERPDLIEGTYDEIARSGCPWRCGSGRPDGAAWQVRRKVRMAPFTAALFRRELFERVGLLDERFESYLEDVDFGIRCAMAGCGGVYLPEAVARHQGSATLGRWHGETVRRIARNQVILLAKHYPDGWFQEHGWQVLVGQSLWGLVALRHATMGAWLLGKWQGIREFREIRAASRNARSATGINQLLRESENTIRDLLCQTGFDRYWKLYFALT